MPVGKIVGKAKIKIYVGKVIRTKPSIYIDTNICRDFIRGERGTETIQTLGLIRDRRYGCFTSVFTAMELTDTEKDSIFFHKKMRKGWDINKIIRARHQKDLNPGDLKDAEDAVKGFFKENSFIKFANLVDEKEWDLALKISSTSNLFAPDVIHLVTAWTSKCSVLLTSDEFFIKEGNEILEKEGVWDKLRICKPKNLLNTLRDMGEKEEIEASTKRRRNYFSSPIK